MTPLVGMPLADAPVEIVERKGIGHPDTLCDALAEALSLSLSRYYRDHFGLILHHNVDKALLWGGISQPAFKGGEVLAPMEIFMAGRATSEFKGIKIPIDEIAAETCRIWLKKHFHALDIDKHVKLHAMIRPGSGDLVDLYLRQKQTGTALANDTSCGVGYAPLDELEQLVLGLEQTLNQPSTKQAHPEIGEDIKIMAIREAGQISVTLGCAFVDRYIANMDDYRQKKQQLANLASEITARFSNKPINLAVNAADGDTPESLYLTVTGTSAESGDDGEVGRGNRVNGLITPYRPMNMEAAAGKNPVTHVGKLYNIVAQRICAALVESIAEISETYCFLVSRIGDPVTQPQVIDLKIRLEDEKQLSELAAPIEAIVHDHLNRITTIQDELLAEAIKVY